MPKHYHVTNGLRGGYIPNDVQTYTTRAAAEQDARQQAAQYRESGEKVRGNARTGYIAREGWHPGEYYDYISVSRCDETDCESDDDY